MAKYINDNMYHTPYYNTVRGDCTFDYHDFDYHDFAWVSDRVVSVGSSIPYFSFWVSGVLGFGDLRSNILYDRVAGVADLHVRARLLMCYCSMGIMFLFNL